MTAWLVADSLPLEKMYIPFGASFIGSAWADSAMKQSREITFSSVFIVRVAVQEGGVPVGVGDGVFVGVGLYDTIGLKMRYAVMHFLTAN